VGQTFDEYELRKTSEARAADLAPLVTERDQASEQFAVIGNAWSRAMFDGLFYVSPTAPAGLPSANLVFVQSRDAIERLSCIGGRTLAGQLLDDGLVQDVYLTTGTKEGGEPGTPLYDKPLQGREVVRKRGTGPDAGVVFEHVTLST
jgi:riboflavin biosynthesis pyrimidine reductase